MTELIISQYTQRTAGWLKEREKLVTASRFGEVLEMYHRKKWSLLNRDPVPVNQDIQRGIDLEEPIRIWFQRYIGQEIKESPLIYSPSSKLGCSPDGLIYDQDGNRKALVEIKCPRRLYRSFFCPLSKYGHPGKVPPRHYAQIQGSLELLDLEFCYYLAYELERNLIVILKVFRNKEYYSKELGPALRWYHEQEISISDPSRRS